MKLAAYPAVQRAYRKARRRLVNRPSNEDETQTLKAQIEFLERLFSI